MVVFIAVVWLLDTTALLAATTDLGQGFQDHGVAAPISNDRGTVATADGQGRNVVLSWLNDFRGGYELLLIDVEAEKAEEYPLPFPPGDHPFASILSQANRFYTHFNSRFVEFDPAIRQFSFSAKSQPQMAMSMTEDDHGVIWSATYPSSGLVSFDPETREFKDYGSLYKQNWAQYPRSVAADSAGWIYLGIGSTLNQIIAFEPATRKVIPIVAEGERAHGYSRVVRGRDGKVYASSFQGKGNREQWLALHKGTVTITSKPAPENLAQLIAGSQDLFHRHFPDGKEITAFSLAERRLTVTNRRTGGSRTFSFDYRSEGALIMGVATAPDGTICGGTAFPMRFFSFEPSRGSLTNRAAYGQWNTLLRVDDRFFVGGYGHGYLLEWDPERPWVETARARPNCNPLWLTDSEPTINRPHELVMTADRKTLVLGGGPGYGYTGGGLLFWERATGRKTVLEHTEILPDQSTLSMVALPDGKLLGGTTTSPGTGGEKKAREAGLYLMDPVRKKVEWHSAVFPGAQNYTDLCAGPQGRVFGFVDQRRFFVFDVNKREIVHQADTAAAFGRCISQQGTRAFVTDTSGNYYILFSKAIARLDPETFEISLLAQSPVAIGAGGDYLDGRIYFANASRLYSYEVQGRAEAKPSKRKLAAPQRLR